MALDYGLPSRTATLDPRMLVKQVPLGKYRRLAHGSATHLCSSLLGGRKSARDLQEMFVGVQNDSAMKSMQIATGRVCFVKYIG